MQFTLTTAVYFLFGIQDIRGSAGAQILVDAYRALCMAFYAIPINLPGFMWYKALKVGHAALALALESEAFRQMGPDVGARWFTVEHNSFGGMMRRR